jgi:fructosamine-3-kinase
MENYIIEIVKRHNTLSKGSIEEIQGGVVGRVYRISNVDASSWILKLNKEEKQEEKDVDEIVYGSSPYNFNESYKILKDNNVPVPEVFAFGVTNDKKFSYIVMQDLSGDLDDYSEEWFREIGHWFGKVNAIEKPYQNSWLEIFKKSLWSRLDSLKEFLRQDLLEKVKEYVRVHIDELIPAESFCFSHLDGFQGIMKKQDGSWTLLGVVDIEDHQYTDQRFVIAGFELNHEMKGNIIPHVFWKEYQKEKNIDPTLESTKDIFKVYYLLVWCYVFRNNPEKFRENISFLENIIEKEYK